MVCWLKETASPQDLVVIRLITLDRNVLQQILCISIQPVFWPSVQQHCSNPSAEVAINCSFVPICLLARTCTSDVSLLWFLVELNCPRVRTEGDELGPAAGACSTQHPCMWTNGWKEEGSPSVKLINRLMTAEVSDLLAHRGRGFLFFTVSTVFVKPRFAFPSHWWTCGRLGTRTERVTRQLRCRTNEMTKLFPCNLDRAIII